MGTATNKRKSAPVAASKYTTLQRLHAEELLNLQAPHAGARRGAHDTQRLVHELQVQQIELEMQNAELRQIRNELEAALFRAAIIDIPARGKLEE